MKRQGVKKRRPRIYHGCQPLSVYTVYTQLDTRVGQKRADRLFRAKINDKAIVAARISFLFSLFFPSLSFNATLEKNDETGNPVQRRSNLPRTRKMSEPMCNRLD